MYRIMLIKLWMCLKMCLVGQGRLGWLSLGVTCKRRWLWAETRAPRGELQQVGAYQPCSSLAASKLLNCCNSKLPGASNSCSKPVSWQEESPRDQTNTVRSQPRIVLLIVQVQAQFSRRRDPLHLRQLVDKSVRRGEQEKKTSIIEAVINPFTQVHSAFLDSYSVAWTEAVFTWREFCEDLWDYSNLALLSTSVPQLSI